MRPILAQLILAFHLGVIAFNVAGLIVIPLGAWLGWRLVRIFWLRALHLASLGVTALQAVLGRDCFLTVWQSALSGQAPQPLITRFVNSLIYWPLPLWVFTAAYVAVFVYVLALWWAVPVRKADRPLSQRRSSSRRPPAGPWG